VLIAAAVGTTMPRTVAHRIATGICRTTVTTIWVSGLFLTQLADVFTEQERLPVLSEAKKERNAN